jgi:cytochrome c biogenesis protein CcdA
MFRKLLSDLGGRSFLLVAGFSFVAMGAATGLLFRAEFEPDHWLKALDVCGLLVAALLGKRAVEEVGAAFGKNGKPDH